MIDAIDRQRMADAMFSADDDEIDMMCQNREYAISVASIQTVLTLEGNIEKRCIDPMAMASFGKMQRKHRDWNRGYIETGFVLVDGINF